MIELIFTYAGAAILSLLALGYCFDRWRRAIEARTEHERQCSEEFIRGMLHDDGFWFSEDPPTMRVIQRLANGDDVAEVREEWRRARKEAQETATR